MKMNTTGLKVYPFHQRLYAKAKAMWKLARAEQYVVVTVRPKSSKVDMFAQASDSLLADTPQALEIIAGMQRAGSLVEKILSRKDNP